MHTIALGLISAVLVLSPLPKATGSGETASPIAVCLSRVSIEITRLHPPVHFPEAFERRGRIYLTPVVDCNDGRISVPKDKNQALEFLDLALPLDLKKSFSEETWSPYLSTEYGSSVDLDIAAYFSDAWRLSEGVGVCESIDDGTDERQACFFRLIESLRGFYLGQGGARREIELGASDSVENH